MSAESADKTGRGEFTRAPGFANRERAQEVMANLRLHAFAGATEPLVSALDTRMGVLRSSNYEYPGRYKRWDLAFSDPSGSSVSRLPRARSSGSCGP